MDKKLIAQQMNRFIQMTIQTANLSDEQAMEVADLYPAWQVPKSYTTGDIFKYGTNVDGETQLYKVLQPHTSAAEYTPDVAVSLYKKVGFTESGTPIWTQPLGATDAYQTGDIVSHNNQLWKSTIDNNVWEPGVYGWEIYDE